MLYITKPAYFHHTQQEEHGGMDWDQSVLSIPGPLGRSCVASIRPTHMGRIESWRGG